MKVGRYDKERDRMIGDHLPTTGINHHRMAFLPSAKFRFFSIKERDHQLIKLKHGNQLKASHLQGQP